MATKIEIEEYYNKTWKDLDDQGLTKPNPRHLVILEKLRQNGLTRNSNVLEIGCGIGTLSNLLAGYLTKGKITAVDISPETIELAKHKFKSRKNLEFQVSDMSNWSNSNTFDIIVLPDVLEHIPLDQHDNLFAKINAVSNATTKLLINIPHPKALEYFIENRKDLLQIIDIPIHTNVLSQNAANHGYYIESLESYSIGLEAEDYQFISLRRNEYVKNYTERNKVSRLVQLIKYKLLAWI
ncbi:MAG: class I SAM-dependent methyltransferase [Bacteroidia bacterium]